MVSTELIRNVFDEGQYLVTAKYLKLDRSVTFSVIDSLSADVSLFLDKEVYGLGETIHPLRELLDGQPSMEKSAFL